MTFTLGGGEKVQISESGLKDTKDGKGKRRRASGTMEPDLKQVVSLHPGTISQGKCKTVSEGTVVSV